MGKLKKRLRLNTFTEAFSMRAYELYETQIRKPQITLRLLNRLKHIRRSNQQAHNEKMAMLPQMYSGERLADEAELEDDISQQIDKAEMDRHP